MTGAHRVMVGLGNRFRGDDRAGLELADRLLARVPRDVQVVAIEGDPVPLLEIFATAELVLVADAVCDGAAPGMVCRFDVSQEPVPGAVFGASTHAFGLAETIELARALGKLNARVIVYGISGADFGPTEALTDTVQAALDGVAQQMLADLALPGLRPAGGKERTHA
jgi:hydrogenase maturation protease